MRSISRTASIIPPSQGKTFFFSNKVTCKSSGDGACRFYEMTGTLKSQTSPPHTHPRDEWIYRLEGEATFQAGDQVFQATPGYAVTLPAGVSRTFATNSCQAKFLVWVSSRAAEHHIHELAEAEREQKLAAEQMRAISQKHHIRYLA